MNESGPYSIPTEWEWAKIKDLSLRITKGATPTSYGFSYTPKGIRFVKVENLSSGRIDTASITQFITNEAHEFLKRSQLMENDLLFSIAGTIGKVAIVDRNDVPANINQAIAIIRCLWHLVEPGYLKLVLDSSFITEFSIGDRARGAAMNNISLEDISNIVCPIAPLNEQRRIVERVQDLRKRMQIARHSLSQMPSHLKLFRQSVLAKAFCGELTERDPNDEPAEKLLEIIKKERRREWEGNRKKRKNLRNSEYQVPEPVYEKKLPELPKGWIWVSLEEASEHVVDCPHSTPKFQKSGKYCVDTTCIAPSTILLEKVRYVSEKTFLERTRRLRPTCGDVLFSREGTIGSAVLVPQNMELCLGQRMMMFRPWDTINSTYFMWALNSPVIRSQIDPLITGTTSPHVNVGDIKKLGLPLAPSLEQERIVMKINELFTRADLIEENVATAATDARMLEQSILAKAFQGELAPQDPNDEPASILLERIRAERAVANKSRGRKLEEFASA
jgi:type I restriction enzyme S subunit